MYDTRKVVSSVPLTLSLSPIHFSILGCICTLYSLLFNQSARDCVCCWIVAQRSFRTFKDLQIKLINIIVVSSNEPAKVCSSLPRLIISVNYNN